jgi:tetratricopeptide (TPR) repeat protein
MKNAKLFFLTGLLFSQTVLAQSVNADSLYAIGNYNQAIAVYRQIDTKAPKIYTKIAGAYRATGNYKMALKNYRIATRRDSTLVLAASQYANLLRQTKHYKKADSVFTALIKRFPENPAFHYQLGLVRERETDSTGISQFQKTLRLNPNHQKALYRCAFYNFQRHKFKNAEVLCQKALKSYPENRPVQRLLARNSYASKNYKTAAKRFENLVNDTKGRKNDYKKLGYAYYRLQKIDKAIDAFKMMKNFDKSSVEAVYNLGLLYNLKGDYEQAKKFLQLSILMKKQGLGKQYQTLGLAFKGEKNYRKAIVYFRKALDENSELYRAQYELAVCADNYYKDLKTKLNYYEKVVRKFKTKPEAEELIVLAQHRINGLKREIHLK